VPGLPSEHRGARFCTQMLIAEAINR